MILVFRISKCCFHGSQSNWYENIGHFAKSYFTFLHVQPWKGLLDMVRWHSRSCAVCIWWVLQKNCNEKWQEQSAEWKLLQFCSVLKHDKINRIIFTHGYDASRHHFIKNCKFLPNFVSNCVKHNRKGR